MDIKKETERAGFTDKELEQMVLEEEGKGNPDLHDGEDDETTQI